MFALNNLIRETVLLRPGEIIFGNDFNNVTTILGSCVAVVLLHRYKNIVGVCHVQFPTTSENARDYGYADNAMKFFYDSILYHGTTIADYQVYVYGGGNMFPSINKVEKLLVGDKNVKLVMDNLKKYSFVVDQSDTGGTRARKLHINRLTNKVTCHYVKKSY